MRAIYEIVIRSVWSLVLLCVWYFTGSEGGVTEAYWYAVPCSYQLLSQDRRTMNNEVWWSHAQASV